ncbi:MAG TPA: CHAT domain-containing protein, partial [Thermoanaerobaculia bacterium]
VVPILDALSELPIHRGAWLIVEALEQGSAQTRRAAAWALAEATGPGVVECLAAAARSDGDEGVRRAALEVFATRARGGDAPWLCERIEDTSRSPEERSLALRALLGAAQTAGDAGGEPWLPGIAVEQVLLALREPEGELALEAAAQAHHAGPSVVPRLLEICQGGRASAGLREAACTALGRMRHHAVAQALLGIVRAAPQVEDDEEEPLPVPKERLARAAAEALARIDVSLLLREPGSTAYYALARLAVTTGCLIYEDRVLGADGRELARLPPAAAPIAAGRSPAISHRAGEPPVPPPDLELGVEVVRRVDGRQALAYTLHSPAGLGGFHQRKIEGRPLTEDLTSFAAKLFEQIERLHEGLDVDDGRVGGDEAEGEWESIGHGLFKALFNTRELRDAYRTIRRSGIRTIRITTDEPAIPWEMVKPYDDEGAGEPIRDDFLGVQFQLTRWLVGSPPATAFRVARLACVVGGGGGGALPRAAAERTILAGLARRHPGVEDASPGRATFEEVTSLLGRGGLDLLHFAGHADFPAGRPDEAKIELEDRPLRARHLYGEIEIRIKADRPLVFLNACRAARQGWALSGLGGWAKTWTQDCQCGAFVGPQWLVKDSLSREFAEVFYGELEGGRTLGEAMLAARLAVREKDPSRPTWLAYVAYGHPGARLVLGERPRAGRADGGGGDEKRSPDLASGGGAVAAIAASNRTNAPPVPPLPPGRSGDPARLKERLGAGREVAAAPIQVPTARAGPWLALLCLACQSFAWCAIALLGFLMAKVASISSPDDRPALTVLALVAGIAALLGIATERALGEPPPIPRFAMRLLALLVGAVFLAFLFLGSPQGGA